MYEEEKIIGPFTIKQFLHTAGGLFLAYLAATYISAPTGTIIAVTMVVGSLILAVRMNPKKIEAENLINYLEEKRITVGNEDFKKWLNKKLAQHISIAQFRKARGLSVDTEHEAVTKILQQKINEMGQ